MHVAYQGIAGAFSEEALVQHFGETVERTGHPSFAAVFTAVAAGAMDAGVVPIENSLAGSILETYDLLLEHDLHVVGEVTVAVRHVLLAPPDMTLGEITRCYSHPQALAQCAAFLAAHDIEPIAAANTAVAARDVAERPEPGSAAIASARAGRLHGLIAIESDIQTRSDNTTRFYVVAREASDDPAADKASIAFTTRNVPGALLGCLEEFAARELNLTRIESRPTGDAPWQYTFHVDVEAADRGALVQAVTDDVLVALSGRVEQARLLGRFRRADSTSQRVEVSVPRSG